MYTTQSKRRPARRKVTAAVVAIFAMLATTAGLALADGTESLGPPSISISGGSGIVAAGTGLITQPGNISINVPGNVAQALLYWEGHATSGNADDTIVVDGHSITGTLIGGPTLFFSDHYSSTYRADITALGLVGSGANSLTVSGLSFDRVNNGAGVLVIYDDGTEAEIGLVDGNDLAFVNFASPLDTTVPQTFTFAAEPIDRTADISLFFSSVSGTNSSYGLRPSVIRIDTGSVTELINVLDSVDSDEWDTINVSVTLPAGATTITIQALSADVLSTGNLPASFAWNAAAASVAVTPEDLSTGRMTGGGSNWDVDGLRITKGFEIHCDLRDPNNLEVNWQRNRFHMTSLDSAVCTDEPGYSELPRFAGFDTFVGLGSGLYNGEPGATIEFRFEDHGEPGRQDRATIIIRDSGGNVVAEVIDNALRHGNFQAHLDTP